MYAQMFKDFNKTTTKQTKQTKQKKLQIGGANIEELLARQSRLDAESAAINKQLEELRSERTSIGTPVSIIQPSIGTPVYKVVICTGDDIRNIYFRYCK